MKLLIYLIYFVKNSIISKSEYISCLNKNKCKDKILISLTLENSQLLNSEQMSFNFDNFENKNDNKIMKLNKPLNITFTKSEVDVLYKMSYIGHFNSKVYEEIIKSTWPLCNEGLWNNDHLIKDSTCKYKKDGNNKLIDNSQGFCCRCPEMTLLTGIKQGINRGNCGFFSTSQSAHCLKFSPNWFGAYEITNLQYDYTIDFKIDIPNIKPIKKLLTITTNKRTVNDKKGIIIKLIGNFLPLNPPPNILNKIVLLPQPENIVNTGNEAVNNNWLLIDKNQLSINGDECNKIGTSYEAFQFQKNKCSVKRNTCLSNQIEDLLKEDENNLKLNKRTKYLLNKKGDFTETFKNNKNEINLKLKFKEIFTTQISFEIDSSNFNFITNLGKGLIIYLKIDNFNAFNQKGDLILKVKNTGHNTSNFEISPICDKRITKIPSKILSLNKNSFKKINFDIYSEAPKGYEHTCDISLKNSIGEIIDKKNITFSSLKTIENSPQFNNTNLYNYTDTSRNIDNINELESKKCKLLCPEAYNLFCILINSCWSGFHKGFFIYGMMLFFIVLIIYKCKKKLKKCCCCCCCCFSGKDDENNTYNDKSKYEKELKIKIENDIQKENDFKDRIRNKFELNMINENINTKQKNMNELYNNNKTLYIDKDIDISLSDSNKSDVTEKNNFKKVNEGYLNLKKRFFRKKNISIFIKYYRSKNKVVLQKNKKLVKIKNKLKIDIIQEINNLIDSKLVDITNDPKYDIF